MMPAQRIQRLRPDANALPIADAVAVRSPDGSVVAFPTSDPSGLANSILEGRAPKDVTSELLKRNLLGQDGPSTIMGTQGAALPRRTGHVIVQGDGVVAAAAKRTLATLGQPTREGDADPAHDVVVLAHDAWDVARLESWNLQAIEAGQPWLACGATEARRIAVGPLVVPGETACYACYLTRRTANSGMPEAFAAHLDAARRHDAPIELPSTWCEVAGMLGAWEATRFQHGVAPACLATVVLLSADTLETQADPVPKAPRCTACSRHRHYPPREPWMPLPRPETLTS